MKLLRKIEGFSLIELLVVIAIIGVLSAIVVPSFISGMPTRRLKSAARDLYGAMQQARLLAVKDNTSVRLCVGSASYYLDTDGDNDCNSVFKQIDFADYDDVQYGIGTASTTPIGANSRTNAETIIFTPAGTAEFSPDSIDGNNTIYFQNSTDPPATFAVFAVIVQISGSVKISWFDGQGGWK